MLLKNTTAVFWYGFLQDATLCRLGLTTTWKVRLNSTAALFLQGFLKEAPGRLRFTRSGKCD